MDPRLKTNPLDGQSAWVAEQVLGECWLIVVSAVQRERGIHHVDMETLTDWTEGENAFIVCTTEGDVVVVAIVDPAQYLGHVNRGEGIDYEFCFETFVMGRKLCRVVNRVDILTGCNISYGHRLPMGGKGPCGYAGYNTKQGVDYNMLQQHRVNIENVVDHHLRWVYLLHPTVWANYATRVLTFKMHLATRHDDSPSLLKNTCIHHLNTSMKKKPDDKLMFSCKGHDDHEARLGNLGRVDEREGCYVRNKATLKQGMFSIGFWVSRGEPTGNYFFVQAYGGKVSVDRPITIAWRSSAWHGTATTKPCRADQELVGTSVEVEMRTSTYRQRHLSCN